MYRLGLGYTQMKASPQEVQLAAMNLGYTYYIDPGTGVTMVSGVVAPNGQSVPLTGDQFLAFIANGKLKSNQAVLSPEDIPASSGISYNGPAALPVNPNPNLPVTGAVATPTVQPSAPVVTPISQITTPQGATIINSSGANQQTSDTSVPASDWFTSSMFGGIPNWGLLAAALVGGFVLFGGHHGK